jgi:hypothetical protein
MCFEFCETEQKRSTLNPVYFIRLLMWVRIQKQTSQSYWAARMEFYYLE